MGKAPLILQYLHDHARLICDRRNEKDGPNTWRITPITDDQRHNIIFHYGTTENFQEFFNCKIPHVEPEKIPNSPTLNYNEVNLKSLERREMMRMIDKKVARQPRLTNKRPTSFSKPIGIFSNGIQANPLPENEAINHRTAAESNKNPPAANCDDRNFIIPNVPVRNPSPSTSSIYLASLPISVSDSSDYEKDLFTTPEDLYLAQYHHRCDMEQCGNNWQDNTVNYTQSQQPPVGLKQGHSDYCYNHRQNSQR